MTDEVREFREGQGVEYADWMLRHSSAYVLNLKTQTYAVLHESYCSHIAPEPGYHSVGQPKICARRIPLLRAWAKPTRSVGGSSARSWASVNGSGPPNQPGVVA